MPVSVEFISLLLSAPAFSIPSLEFYRTEEHIFLRNTWFRLETGENRYWGIWFGHFIAFFCLCRVHTRLPWRWWEVVGRNWPASPSTLALGLLRLLLMLKTCRDTMTDYVVWWLHFLLLFPSLLSQSMLYGDYTFCSCSCLKQLRFWTSIVSCMSNVHCTNYVELRN